MSSAVRLAVLDRGEPAVRLLTALSGADAGVDRAGAPLTVTTVATVPAGRDRDWYTREADATVALPAQPDAVEVAAALAEAGVQAVWPGPVPGIDAADLVAACADAGLVVVGPDAATIRRLADPVELARLAGECGLPLLPEGAPAAGKRLVEADVMAADGAAWVLGLTDVGVQRAGQVSVAEFPAPDVPAASAAAIESGLCALLTAVGYRGAGVATLTLDPADGSVALLGIDVTARPERALLDDRAGLDLLRWRLDVALGRSLPAAPPSAEGHTVGVRVLALDPARGYARSGGAIRMLSMPAGTGVRIDTSLREGDTIATGEEDDPLVATVAAWGRDRGQALERLRRALDRLVIVLQTGATDRSELIALLQRPELAAGPVPLGWYDAQVASGALVPPASPVALLAAAVESYGTDLASVRSAFLASAERGRPANPEQVGARLALSYRGAEYAVRVDRVGPDAYRVSVDGVPVRVEVEPLGAFERRLVVGGRKYRIVTSDQGAVYRVGVDGTTHTVVREDGFVVRALSPALVESLQVAVGDEVVAGQVLASLESMKMVSSVAAPFDGVVTAVAVLPNSQVERGAPLLRIRAHDEQALPVGGRGDGARLDFTALADAAGGEATLPQVYDRLRDVLLGYDIDPAGLRALLAAQRRLAQAAAPDDAQLLASEDALIDLYADIAALYRPRGEAEDTDPAEALIAANTQEFFLAYLQWLDADRAGLPQRYRARLARALARYGVDGLTRTPALESAMLWMFRSFARVPQLSPAVAAVLERRLAAREALIPIVQADDRARLERLAAAAQSRYEDVAGLARDAVFALFDEPVMAAVVTETESEMADHLRALRDDPDRPDRADRIGRLVWHPHPMRGMLLHAWLDAADDGSEDPYRWALLEVNARRFFRIRGLHGLGHVTIDGVPLAFADYEYLGVRVHLVVAYCPLQELPGASRVIAQHLATAGEDRDVVVDLVTWRDGVCPPMAETIAHVEELLAGVDVGRPLHRLDLTITSLGGSGAEDRRTHHLTYRHTDGALVEDPLYRNLHPMLAKRLDLWRLSNFDLQRLPSPEDVYLFEGVARSNPRDRRLFAIAEVRDLVPVRGADDGRVTYPRLGRIGLEALAAMRAALATYAPRQRPVANRLILSVRPTWTVPPEQWNDLARGYEPLARGADLEKIVMHVQVPQARGGGRSAVVDKVLFIEGVGRRDFRVRIDDPGPDPIRPLTAYAQKVLTARRFGSPYPYEITRMLTPAAGQSSAFPPGHFQELDLADDGETLVPVDRPAGQNSAHLVVGVITNVTDVVPEGMRRVAVLSDPTQGLGNLAEPECRRINAALALALRERIPLEWYAVSSGALIAMDSGTENMDWISLTLRRLIEYTQAGGIVNIIVTGINVGGQPYWNAEATMLMHTKGVLIMSPASAMVLTGKQALDFSGAVSADDNSGIGGYDRIMGPNGQGQYWAPSFEKACEVLMRHYDLTYVVPGERFPRPRATADPVTRDVRSSPHADLPGSTFTRVADVFDPATNPDRKLPFDMRSVMRAVSDADCEPLERWRHWVDSDTVIVWDTTIGGIPVSLLGLEAHAVPRQGFVPSYGPTSWTSGTLFPQSSRKAARAINAASGGRPLVVLANLSGFDGSPESMRHWQLEYGAEIGRAVTNFDGPIVFVVVSRYHGGAFVVFSKQLNAGMEIAAVRGSFASVIGGAPAAATVFARDVKKRTLADPRVVEATEAVAAASGAAAAEARATLAAISAAVRSEKLGEVAGEFDAIHTIERARSVGSVDTIIDAEQIRPYIVDALQRRMTRFTAR